MTPPFDHDLLAVHALDALDPDERAGIDDLLATDLDAQREAAVHFETLAAMTPNSPVPTGLIDGVLAAISDPESSTLHAPDAAPDPPGQMTVASPQVTESDDAEVTALALHRRPDRPSRGVSWVAAGLVAVAAAVVAVLVTASVLDTSTDEQSPAELVAAALDDDVLDQVDLHTPDVEDSPVVARAALAGDGSGYLQVEDLPILSPGEAYQVWQLVGDDGTPVSLGLVADDGTALFQASEAGAIAISREPATGSVAPTEVVAVGLL